MSDITGDPISGTDVTRLDNVLLQSVPEPSTGLPVALALGFLLSTARRMKRL